MPEAVRTGAARPPLQTPWEASTGLLLAGLLLSAGFGGDSSLLLTGVPAAVLSLAAATGLLFWRGDSRLPQMLTLGSALAVLPVLLLLIRGDLLFALMVLCASAAVWLAAGRVSLLRYPQIESAPPPEVNLVNAARIGTDQALLAAFKLMMRSPRGEHREQVIEEFARWYRLGDEGDLATALHTAPPDLVRTEHAERQIFGLRYRHIHWESGFEAGDWPGAERFSSVVPNQRGHAWLMEHPGKPRPWLLTIHGYRMGSPLFDLRAFDPGFLHHKLGLNIASIVLPLHGPRRSGVLSGSGFLDGDFSMLIHAERQAVWDMRRLLSWLRLNRHAPRIGVHGISLGGYNTALLAGLEGDLACAVAGIPVFDLAQTMTLHMPLDEAANLHADGIGLMEMRKVLEPVSPASFAPRIAPAQLGIFAGTADTLALPDQPLALARHWQCALPRWYAGAHLSFAGTGAQRGCLTDVLAQGQLI